MQVAISNVLAHFYKDEYQFFFVNVYSIVCKSIKTILI